MKQLLTLFILMLFTALGAAAQNCESTDTLAVDAEETTESCIFNGDFICPDTGLRLHLDLDEETIDIPGMSFLGPTNGYLDGTDNNHVYGVWMLLKFSVDGNKATLRFSNDIGSDSQDVLLTLNADGTLQYAALGANNIKKVEGGRKLVKIPAAMTLQREK